MNLFYGDCDNITAELSLRELKGVGRRSDWSDELTFETELIHLKGAANTFTRKKAFVKPLMWNTPAKRKEYWWVRSPGGWVSDLPY